MALTVSISGYVPPAGVPLTMAALRKLASGFTVTLSGTVSGGEVVDGSITPAKVSPGAYFYGVGSWSAPNKYTVTLSPPLAGLADGVRLFFKASAANVGGVDTTLVVNGLAETPIRRRMTEQLAKAEILAGQIVEVIYNSGHFQILSNTLLERTDYALTTGTVASNRCSAYVVDLDYVDVTKFTARMLHARLHADCNATPTIKVGAAGTAKTLKWLDGRDIAQSQLRKGQVIGFVYDSALDACLLLGEQPNGVYGAVETSGSASTWTATIPGFPESPVAGLTISLKVVASNNGPVTLEVTSPASGTIHPAKPVKKHFNRALDAFDIINNSYVILTYDGTNYVLQSPTTQPVIMAMAQFDGTLPNGTITPRRAYNIHATNLVTKHGTGDYTINFATALPSVHYLVHVTVGTASAFGAGGVSLQGQVFDPATNQLTGSVRIHTGSASDGSAGNAPYIYVSVIGFPNF